MALVSRGTPTSLVALFKNAFATTLRSEKLTVRLEADREYKEIFIKLSRQLQSIEDALMRLRDEGFTMPETILELDNGQEVLVKKLDALTDAITSLTESVKKQSSTDVVK